MASFIFSIMHAIVSWRTKEDNIDVYLKANKEDNPAAWLYYEKRGFRELEEPGDNNFPMNFEQCFEKLPDSTDGVEGLLDHSIDKD